MELFPAPKIRYKREFGLSGFVITGLPCISTKLMRREKKLVAAPLLWGLLKGFRIFLILVGDKKKSPFLWPLKRLLSKDDTCPLCPVFSSPVFCQMGNDRFKLEPKKQECRKCRYTKTQPLNTLLYPKKVEKRM